MSTFPLRWVKNDSAAAECFFGGGRSTPEFTYQGAPISADFELTYANLAPYVTDILDQAAEIEAMGKRVTLIGIQNGKATVW